MFRIDIFRTQTKSHPAALAFVLLACAPLLDSLGCASPGQPQPPALNLPNLAENPTASRVGDQVSLAWTTPATTTDGPAIKGAVTAVVCLESAAATASAPAVSRPGKRSKKKAAPQPQSTPYVCDAVQRVPAPVGASRASVALTPAQASGPPALLAYRVELENAKGRTAGPSQPVFAAGGAAPAAGSLKVSARREGALVQWTSAPDGAVMELTRTLISTAEKPLESKPAARPAKSPLTPKGTKAPAREVVLRADSTTDSGGMLDTTAIDGGTYTYTAQRVRTVTLGGHALELRSAVSPAYTFTYRDTFPPRPPTGLVLVPGGGFGELPSIDLSWEANFDSDMLGYNIYRSTGAADFVRLNPEPVPSPSFRDLHVEPGGQYAYRVTAVDQRHNESAPSGTARETLRR